MIALHPLKFSQRKVKYVLQISGSQQAVDVYMLIGRVKSVAMDLS